MVAVAAPAVALQSAATHVMALPTTSTSPGSSTAVGVRTAPRSRRPPVPSRTTSAAGEATEPGVPPSVPPSELPPSMVPASRSPASVVARVDVTAVERSAIVHRQVRVDITTVARVDSGIGRHTRVSPPPQPRAAWPCERDPVRETPGRCGWNSHLFSTGEHV